MTLYSLMTKNKNGAVARVVFSVPKTFQVRPQPHVMSAILHTRQILANLLLSYQTI